MSITWDASFAAIPANTNAMGSTYQYLQDTKTAVHDRMGKEHVMDYSDPSNAANDGWHLLGSAVIYIGSSAPTTRPDGTTALDTNDTGRLFLNTSGSPALLYYWDGSAWVLFDDYYNAAGSGYYIKKPNKVLIQWGIATVPAYPTGQAVIWPIAFNTILSVTATVFAQGNYASIGDSPGTSSMTLFQSSSGPQRVGWQAIGTYL